VLGLALLAMAVGALLGIPAAGWAAGRIGSRAVVRASAITFFAALALPVLAPSLPLLVAALFVLGASNGALDVSMNAQAAAIEARWPRPIMSAFHGTWSVGGLAGAGAAALALRLGVTPAMHVLGAAALFGGATGVALLALLPPTEDVRGDTRGVRRPTGALVGLGTIALLALMAEGAMGDWSAVYLEHSLGTSASTAALGFAAFSLTMAAGRFLGDALVARWGNATIVRATAGTGALGFATALALGHPLAAIAGCAAVGLGLANLIPIVFRAAGRLPGVAASEGIAAVGTAGYVGFLAGPPLIGLTAEVATLPGALVIVAGALGWIAAVAGRFVAGAPRA
jgi:MFS family permease